MSHFLSLSGYFLMVLFNLSLYFPVFSVNRLDSSLRFHVREYPWWKLLRWPPLIPACVVPSAWASASLCNLILINWIWQKQWDVTLEIRLFRKNKTKQNCSFCHDCCFSPSLGSPVLGEASHHAMGHSLEGSIWQGYEACQPLHEWA